MLAQYGYGNTPTVQRSGRSGKYRPGAVLHICRYPAWYNSRGVAGLFEPHTPVRDNDWPRL